jgi:hypothetical protein
VVWAKRDAANARKERTQGRKPPPCAVVLRWATGIGTQPGYKSDPTKHVALARLHLRKQIACRPNPAFDSPNDASTSPAAECSEGSWVRIVLWNLGVATSTVHGTLSGHIGRHSLRSHFSDMPTNHQLGFTTAVAWRLPRGEQPNGVISDASTLGWRGHQRQLRCARSWVEGLAHYR